MTYLLFYEERFGFAAMQKIINNPNNVVDEMLKGYLKCHSDTVIKLKKNPRVYIRKDYKEIHGKVGVVSGGGTGHYPAFIGYLRPFMLDAVAVGDLFIAPDTEVFLEAFRAADFGNGVICIHGNYELDNKNVNEAIALAKKEGIIVKRVVANDDITFIRDGDRTNSRGLAGEVFLWKLAGTAAYKGMSLDEIVDICNQANNSNRSIGVGLSSCVIPKQGVAKFDVVEGTMEFGIGHHGDPGMKTYKLRSANKIADLIMQELLNYSSSLNEREVAVMVSGLGGTTQMELFILFNRIFDILNKKKIKIFSSYVGNYFTSLDMKGATVTLLSVDERIKELLQYEEMVCLTR